MCREKIRRCLGRIQIHCFCTLSDTQINVVTKQFTRQTQFNNMSAPEFYDDIKWLKTLFSIYHADLVQECTQGLLRRKRDDFVRSHKVWADTKEIGSLLHHINNEEQTSWYKAWFDGWYNLPLMIDNQVVCDSKFPKAIECIKRIKNVKIAGFSYLLPNAQIGNHQDSMG